MMSNQSNSENLGTRGPIIGSLNCNGLGNRNKRESVLNWLKAKPENIFLLQETHSSIENEREWERVWGGTVYFCHGASNSTGVAILIKGRSPHIKVIRHKIVIDGRSHYIEIEIDGVNYCIANLYAPNNDDVTFYDNSFLEIFGRPRNDFLIVGGDYNTVLDNNLDKMGGSSAHANHRTQAFLKRVISDYGLSDVFRVNNATSKLFTHFNKQYKTATRLDFFLIDDTLINFPRCEASISHGFMSDHSYISIDIQGSNITQGRGYWKLNNSHLEDEEFVQGVKNIISDTSGESFDSYRGLWDVIKFKIKDYAIRYGASKKKEKCRVKENLQKKIDDIKKTSDFMKRDDMRKEMFEAEIKLNEIISKEIKGNITRSRARWVEEGERSNRYFFGLEKVNGKKKILSKLSDPEKGLLLDQDGITDHVVRFYQKLFSSSNPSSVDIENYIESTNLDKITSTLYEKLEGGLDIAELDSIIPKLKNNKSPGWDGLSSEFYKTFWDEIKNILFLSLQESIDSGYLSPSQRIGVLTIIPKPKPPSELVHIKNWRPITLLNTDYKIFTHAIKNRLLESVPFIIDRVQSGFQAGKSTCDNLILMCLALEHFQDNESEEGLILEIDFEKAFDSVEHKFVTHTLHAMGFGRYMIRLVETALGGCMSLANVNGHLSTPIYIMRGLHQGSPLSPLLFLIVAQVYTARMRDNPNIEGLNISAINLLLSLFADDTDVFLKAKLSCVAAVFDELDSFGATSGCKANVSKTRCIPLGGAKHNQDLLQNLRSNYGSDFTTDSFTALGIQFSNSLSITDIVNMNYNAKIKKAMSWIESWKRRDLTIYGKVTIIKSLVMSQFTYLAIPLPRPNQKILKEISTMIFHFLWGCKRDKIKRSIVTQPTSNGGIDMFLPEDFILGLKTSLVTKLVSNTFDHNWKRIILNQLKYPEFPRISIENGLAKANCHFTGDLLTAYQEWKTAAANSKGGSVNHCIWSHKNITDVGARLWNDNLIRRNIMYISDFITDDYMTVLPYSDFLNKWNLDRNDITSHNYVNIKMAIRRYNCPTVPGKSIETVESTINLSFFERPSVKGRQIRIAMTKALDLSDNIPLNTWQTVLRRNGIDWPNILYNIRFGISNNYKLIQFQYKLIMRISTCKLMRWKMKIEKDSGNCNYCNVPESLTHIFIDCIHTSVLINKLESLIRANFDQDYSDATRYHFITCSHHMQEVNYINMIAKWYISKQYQFKKEVRWDLFLKHIGIFLVGEKVDIKRAINSAVRP